VNTPGLLKPATVSEKWLGERIKKEAKPGEVIFLLGNEAQPQLVYYAGRNIKHVESKEDALQFLKERNAANGIIFKEAEGEFSSLERIALAP
jgi:hypothetical protein